MKEYPVVIMVSPNFHPYIGGAEKQALELSKALAGLGVSVSVLTRRASGLPCREIVSGIPVHRVWAAGGGIFNSLSFLLSSFFRLLRSDYGVAHVHLAGSPALAAGLAARLSGRLAVVKVGGGRGIGEIAVSSRTLAGRLKLAALKWLKPRFVAVTRDLASEMAEFGFNDTVRVIPNGVDVERYRAGAPEERAGLRAALDFPEGPVFLFVGRLSWEKRLPEFLEAFAEAGAGATAIFVGDGPEAGALRRRAQELGLGGRARFLAPIPEIERVYRAADVFILPSVSEGLSNALLEAMASGLAVLASRVGGTAEAIEDGKTGILFAVEDGGALRAGMKALIEDPALRGRLGRAARKCAEERYSMRRVAERYLEVYR